MGRDDGRPKDPATEAFEQGVALVKKHPVFGPLLATWPSPIVRRQNGSHPANGWVVLDGFGHLHTHPTRRGSPQEWAYVIAHALLHLGLGHMQYKSHPREWQAACDYVVARFLRDLKFGRAPEEMLAELDLGAQDENRLYERFCRDGIPPHIQACGTAGREPDMREPGAARPDARKHWQATFAAGLVEAVDSAVEVAAGRRASLSDSRPPRSIAERARGWFVSSYPLLGSLAATFRLVEDAAVCTRMQISVAAVDAVAKEIYVNPAAGLDEESARFVLAHELLHVGLRHQARRLGRDPYLWNVACDYVVNGWLIEMELGRIPAFGGLLDPALKGLSAEAVYDIIVTDLRRARKLETLRGYGRGDMLGDDDEWWRRGDGVTLDDFYRRCLTQGLVYHRDNSRGLLPAGLIEEIRALDQPPIRWDVELARWFDAHFSPLEKRRTFARLSRRQSATPDIVRPLWVPHGASDDGRTFGVVLDTSGSMDRHLLAQALGAIGSYAVSRDVGRARVVFCDAHPYDQGYLAPDAILDTVRVRGRGGTTLQPGIDLLEGADDFPKDGPLLVITDGECDRLQIRREHAFLVPAGSTLPFVPRGPVFRID